MDSDIGTYITLHYVNIGKSFTVTTQLIWERSANQRSYVTLQLFLMNLVCNVNKLGCHVVRRSWHTVVGTILSSYMQAAHR